MEESAYQLLLEEDEDIEATGDISGEYTCTWKDCTGTLYAGSKGVYFVGAFFLFERKLLLQWDEIRRVEKVHHGIEVICRDETVHSFHGIVAPERLWILLITLHNDALLDRKGKPRVFVKRRNSDPWSSALMDGLHVDTAPDTPSTTPSATVGSNSKIGNFNENEAEKVIGARKLHPLPCKFGDIPGKLYTGEDALCFCGKRFFWEKRVILINWKEVKQVQIISVTDRNRRGKADDSCDRSDGIQIVTEADIDFRFYGIVSADKVWAVLMSLHNESLTRRPGRTPTRGVRRNNSDPMMASQPVLNFETTDERDVQRSGRSAPPETPRQTMEEEWQNLVGTLGYSNVVVKDHILHANLDSFVDLFVKDDAKFSLGRYLESRGDSNLKESPWRSDGNNSKRVINYSHPVNVPMAPPQAEARKEQTYRRYGEYGLCIKTTTHVDDLPMADCFYVADCIRVQPCGENRLSVSMDFELTFVKSTIFKAVMTKTAEKEVYESIGELANYMSNALGDSAVAVPKQIPVVRRPTMSLSFNLSAVVLTVCVLNMLFQALLLLELRGVKTAIASLQVPTGTPETVCALGEDR